MLPFKAIGQMLQREAAGWNPNRASQPENQKTSQPEIWDARYAESSSPPSPSSSDTLRDTPDALPDWMQTPNSGSPRPSS